MSTSTCLCAFSTCLNTDSVNNAQLYALRTHEHTPIRKTLHRTSEMFEDTRISHNAQTLRATLWSPGCLSCCRPCRAVPAETGPLSRFAIHHRPKAAAPAAEPAAAAVFTATTDNDDIDATSTMLSVVGDDDRQQFR